MIFWSKRCENQEQPAKRTRQLQHLSPFTPLFRSSSQTCVYATVVSGLACLANLGARNRSRDARYTFVTAVCLSAWKG
jgi:hypothetical protein